MKQTNKIEYDRRKKAEGQFFDMSAKVDDAMKAKQEAEIKLKMALKEHDKILREN